jgi:hypothetical protein
MDQSLVSRGFNRRAFLKVGSVLTLGLCTPLPSMWEPHMGLAEAFAATGEGELPPPPGEPTGGNMRAIEIAQASKLVKGAFADLWEVATQIQDASLKQATLDMLANPAPTYQLQSPSAADREEVRSQLLAEKLIPEQTTVEGIFPKVDDPRNAPQPFWSTAGSGYGSHHSYPGGLAAHVGYNATIASRMVANYEKIYTETMGVQPLPFNRDFALAAPLWHDNQKPTVFQWNDDGSEFAEQTIADTGAHHPLSGAEAIVRGLPAPFVLALLSAHDEPSIDNAPRVVKYARAAAIIARVDPATYGLLKPDDKGGFVLASDYPNLEAFINFMSDHDWVFTVHAAHTVIPMVQSIARDKYGIDAAADAPRFNNFRNRVFATLSQERIYVLLAAGGQAAVIDAIAKVV